MTKPWVVFLVLASIVFSFFYVDQWIAQTVYGFHFKKITVLMKLITMLGVGALYSVGLVVAALYCRYRSHNKCFEIRLWILWLCVVVPNFICLILKTTLGRARPELLFSDNLYGFYGYHTSASYWSFPSGHTTTIMGFVFGLCALFPKHCVVFILTGLLVAVSRVFLIQHYLSDVLTASYLALIEVGLLYSWLKPKSLASCSNALSGDEKGVFS